MQAGSWPNGDGDQTFTTARVAWCSVMRTVVVCLVALFLGRVAPVHAVVLTDKPKIVLARGGMKDRAWSVTPPLVQLRLPLLSSSAELTLRRGEQPEDVARNFCTANNIHLAKVPSIVAEIEKKLPRLVATLPLDMKDGGTPLSLKFYDGWNITETVDSFVKTHGFNDAEHGALMTQAQAIMPLVTLWIQGDATGTLVEPPLTFLNGDHDPDIVAVNYCLKNRLDVTQSAHRLSQEIRNRLPPDIAKTFAPVRKVLFVVPMHVNDDQVAMAPFFENDVPSDFSTTVCSRFSNSEGCYDSILQFINQSFAALKNQSMQNDHAPQTLPPGNTVDNDSLQLEEVQKAAERAAAEAAATANSAGQSRNEEHAKDIERSRETTRKAEDVALQRQLEEEARKTAEILAAKSAEEETKRVEETKHEVAARAGEVVSTTTARVTSIPARLTSVETVLQLDSHGSLLQRMERVEGVLTVPTTMGKNLRERLDVIEMSITIPKRLLSIEQMLGLADNGSLLARMEAVETLIGISYAEGAGLRERLEVVERLV